MQFVKRAHLNIIFRFNLQTKFLYSQRAITPMQFFETFLIKNPQTRNNAKELMHPLYLFTNRIIPFDYDYFFWANTILIGYQKQLQIQDILEVMKLSKQYAITHEGFWNHFENQILLRVLKGPGKVLKKKYQQEDKKLNQLLTSLQKTSKDNFEILTKQYLQQQLKAQQQQQTKEQLPIKFQSINQTKFLKNTKNDIKFQHLTEISQLLIWKNSKNSRLIGQLLEITMIDFQQVSLQQMILAIKLMNHQCMVFMQIYNEKKQQYTPRSIKRIYKMQSFYYEEIIPSLIPKLSQCQPQQIILLLDNMIVFPIKKRKFRMKIIEEVKKVISIFPEDKQKSVIKLLIQICGKDKKMLNKYQLITHDEQTQQQLPEIPNLSNHIV